VGGAVIACEREAGNVGLVRGQSVTFIPGDTCCTLRERKGKEIKSPTGLLIVKKGAKTKW